MPVSDLQVPMADLSPDVGEALERRGARQVHLYRALAHSPELARTWFDFVWGLRDRATTPRSLREIAILRTAVRHGSEYEWAHHVRMAKEAGVLDETIRAVERWPDDADLADVADDADDADVADVADVALSFSQDEELALRLTDAICDGSVPDALVDACLASFGATGYVEMVLTISAYVMVPRVLEALRVPLEPTAS